MPVPGLDRLTLHFPDLTTIAGRLRLGLIGFVAFALPFAAMLGLDARWPGWTLAGPLAVIAAAYFTLRQFFHRRARLRTRHGDAAYARAFTAFALPGVSMIWAAILHTPVIPGPRIWSGWPAAAAAAAGVYLALTGVALFARAILHLGFDNLAMLYVYFPAKGRLVESAVYGFLRHPAYSGVVRLGLALGLWRGTWAAVTFGLFVPLGLTVWLRTVEERELVARFGDGYSEYRRRTPAFFPRTRDTLRFWRFLALGQ